MFEPLHARVITLERVLFDGKVSEVNAPALNGYLGILPRHAPLMAALGNGVLKISTAEGRQRFFAVFGGFLQVENNRIIVLADRAVAGGDIDFTEASARLEETKIALEAGPGEGQSKSDLRRAFEQARIRWKVSRFSLENP